MYKVGDKFEIEIESILTDGISQELYAIKGFRSLVFDKYGLDKLKKANPYDAEDLAEARREAYDRGYKWGIETTEKAYQAQAKEEKAKTVKASELPIDTVVLCGELQEKRHFAILLNSKMYAFADGFSSKNSVGMYPWKTMTLEDGTEVIPE